MDIEQKLDTPLGRGIYFLKLSIDTIIAQQKQEAVAANAPGVYIKYMILTLESASRATSKAQTY